MNPLLLILNPRKIPAALEAFNQLNIDKAWLTGHTEKQLEPVIRHLVNTTRHTHYCAISDDCIVTQHALDTVLHLADTAMVATGYCNLDRTNPLVNLTRRPLHGEPPTANSYTFITEHEARTHSRPFRTYFTGMCLTTAPSELWQRFPFRTYPNPPDTGCASDYHLSIRLQRFGIPIHTHPAAHVTHLKERWNQADQHADHQLHLDQPQVTLQVKGGRS